MPHSFFCIVYSLFITTLSSVGTRAVSFFRYVVLMSVEGNISFSIISRFFCLFVSVVTNHYPGARCASEGAAPSGHEKKKEKEKHRGRILVVRNRDARDAATHGE